MRSFRRRLLLEGVTALAGAAILALFANNEQGLWYDPSQLDTMFQDSAGTTPVTAAGDPVGLILDKRLWGGKTLAQVFAAATLLGGLPLDSAPWTLQGAAAVLGNTVTGLNNGDALRLTGLTVGKTYKVEAATSAVSGSWFWLAEGTGTTYRNSIGNCIFRATSTGLLLYCVSAGSVTLSSLLVKEIPGNHASQATSASRPVLARVPFGGRRNLLTRTEEFDNAAWVKSQSTSTLPVVTANAGLDPDGNMFADRIDFGEIDNAADASVIYQDFTFTAADAGDWSGGLYLKAFAAGDVGKKLYVYFLDGPATLEAVTAVTLTNSYQLVTPTSNLGSGGSRRLSFGTLGANFAAGATSQAAVSVLAAQAQFEKGTTRTAYQKVTSTHDVTEAGKADCWHLSADGSDDGMAAGSIDFSGGDKLLVLAGARKNSDAAAGTIFELGDPSATAGASGLGSGTTSGDASRRTWNAQHHGGAAQTVAGAAIFTSPVTTVLSALFDRGQAAQVDEIRLRADGAQQSLTFSNANTASGNLANQPCYIGRRTGSSVPFNGLLFGLVIRAGLPDAGQLAAAEQFMAGKTGVSF